MTPPNFSPFPFAALPHLTARQAAIESAIARQVGARQLGGPRLEKLVGPVRVVATSIVQRDFDPYAVLAEVRFGGRAIAVAASGFRAIAQRLLGGAEEQPAPRPPTLAEQAIFALVVAAALEDAGISGEVWPLSERARDLHARELDELARRARLAIEQRELIGRGGIQPGELAPPPTIASGRRRAGAPEIQIKPTAASPDTPAQIGLELALDAGGTALAIVCWIPAELILRAPPARTRNWTFALPVVVARCWLPREAITALGVRDVVVVEPALSLTVGDGAFGLTAAPGAVEARIATGYVRAVAPTDDEAGLPLTVQLGTTQLSLRRLGELAIGELIGLGRPLAGPYEIHVGGRLIGHGELVDLDGEIGVRIVSLSQE